MFGVLFSFGHATACEIWVLYYIVGSPGGASGKEPSCQCRREKRPRDRTQESGRAPGGGHGNPLQYSCLEHPTDCSPPGSSVTKSRTPLQRLSTHAYYIYILYTIIYGIFFFRFFSIIDYYKINTSLFVFSLLHKNLGSGARGKQGLCSSLCRPHSKPSGPSTAL